MLVVKVNKENDHLIITLPNGEVMTIHAEPVGPKKTKMIISAPSQVQVCRHGAKQKGVRSGRQ